MKINILHTSNRMDRYESFTYQLKEQNITDYKIWEGIVDRQMSFRGICLSHKMMVLDAKARGEKELLVMENDCKFFDIGAFQYFMDNKPEDFDMYLGNIFDGHIKEDNTVHTFSGLTLYIIHERFFDKFLSVKNESNIDREIGGMGKFVVCNPMVCTQIGGLSCNTKMIAEKDYTSKLIGRKLYSNASSKIQGDADPNTK